MDKSEFKKRWESNKRGGGITAEDIAECAREWGLHNRPKICSLSRVLYDVLVEAKVNDAEGYNPGEEDEDYN